MIAKHIHSGGTTRMFIIGMSKALVVRFGQRAARPYSYRHESFEVDAARMRSDFERVGSDIENAVASVRGVSSR